MQALRIYAGPKALAHIRREGLQPAHIGAIPGAAGGPKGLILGPLDRFLFDEWLPQSAQPVDLIGASIGAWRMATACLDQPRSAFEQLEHDYIHQHYEVPPGRKRPTAVQVSREFRDSLDAFYGGRIDEVLNHPRYRLHVVTSRGRRLLRREHPWATPIGYALAYLANAAQRRAMGGWLQRVVFSSGGMSLPPLDMATPNASLRSGARAATSSASLPFACDDFDTQACALTADNFMDALQASCSIPFVLQAVHDIAGAPPGAYWDGGITDYHLHLHYQPPPSSPIVLYPHFQQAVVPGWLDKALKWRHRATPFLDDMVLLAPSPQWVRTLPNGKLPDRSDFVRYGSDLAARVRVWQSAVAASRQLADEFAQWLARPDPARVQPL